MKRTWVIATMLLAGTAWAKPQRAPSDGPTLEEHRVVIAGGPMLGVSLTDIGPELRSPRESRNPPTNTVLPYDEEPVAGTATIARRRRVDNAGRPTGLPQLHVTSMSKCSTSSRAPSLP